jgi:3-dehydroquinate synthetase
MAPLQPKGTGYFHGEGVAIGMTYTSEGEARERIEKLLLKYGLPVSDPFDPQDLMRLALKDKKRGEAGTKIVWVDAIGSYSFRNLDDTQLFTLINNRKNEK